MKIGIGITTRNRAENLRISLEHFSKFWPKDVRVKFYIHDDGSTDEIFKKNYHTITNFWKMHKSQVNWNFSDRIGVAGGKNDCLKNLKDCDYIFLFDDDCWPIKDGWADFFINAHKQTGVHHFNYMESEIHSLKSSHQNGDFIVESFGNVCGVMLFLTKEVLSKVGGFNKDYKIYGYEHCGYTDRVYRAGLHNGYDKYLSLKGTSDYLFSLDHAVHNASPNHHLLDPIAMQPSSLTSAEAEIYISENSTTFNEDLHGPVYREL